MLICTKFIAFLAVLYHQIGLAIKIFVFYLPVFNQELKKLSHLHKQLSDKYVKKRLQLYAMVGYVCADWFCTARSKKLSKQEKMRLIYLSILMPLVDDLYDEHNWDSNKISQYIIQNQESKIWQLQVSSFIVHHILVDWIALNSKVVDAALFSQNDSLSQLENKKLDFETILKYTKQKGATATMLYRAVLDLSIEYDEKVWIEKIGFLVQFVNDAFDTYKDANNGQQTLFTVDVKFKQVKDTYSQLIKDIYLSPFFVKLPFFIQKKLKAKMTLITARGWVCIEQLDRLAAQNDGILYPTNFTRKQLVCDMDMISNIIYSISIGANQYKG